MMSDILHPLKIGDVEIPVNLILAPMAGVTDLPFRILCHENGAGMAVTEMVSAKAVLYKNKNTKELLLTDSAEGITSLQLFGSDPDSMAEAARILEELPFPIIDINMGCPVPKVVGNGEGSALMKDPVLAGKIIAAVAGAVKKPVTVKMRAGFFENERTAAEIAHVAEESGAKAVAVHARTRAQYYSGQADYSIIGEVKERVSIPVIGNGDIRKYADVKRMYDVSGCDGFMIGRAARGNPWIFNKIIRDGEKDEPDKKRSEKYTEHETEWPRKSMASDQIQAKKSVTSEMARPDRREVADMIMRQARMMVELKGETTGIHEMRKHVAWYTAGFPGAAEIRRKANQIETLQDLENLTRNKK